MLPGRERLSLDLLERWGTDLLEALVALDRAGVDHRDIKPANLGVREGRSDRVKHLVLFDFSLSRAGAAAVTAGTPPTLKLQSPGIDTEEDHLSTDNSVPNVFDVGLVQLIEVAFRTGPSRGPSF